MAKKEKATEADDEGVLVSAAKVIGTAAGKIARLAGAVPEASEPAKSQKVPKLSKKGKQGPCARKRRPLGSARNEHATRTKAAAAESKHLRT